MANEITFRFSVDVASGGLNDRFQVQRQQIDQGEARKSDRVLAIGTTEETISFTDITTEGVLIIHNLDATNFVTVGPDATGQVDFLKIKPGEAWPMRVAPGTTIKATADTASCDVRFILYAD